MLVEAALQNLFAILHVALLRRLDLHGRVEDLEVLLQKLGDIIKGVAWVTGHDYVGSEDGLLIRQAPKVEVMDLLDHLEIHDGVVDILGVNGLRS